MPTRRSGCGRHAWPVGCFCHGWGCAAVCRDWKPFARPWCPCSCCLCSWSQPKMLSLFPFNWRTTTNSASHPLCPRLPLHPCFDPLSNPETSTHAVPEPPRARPRLGPATPASMQAVCVLASPAFP
eukprot:363965-Chlamydomonas_euryale.AAC.8